VVTGRKRYCHPIAGVRLLFGLFLIKAAQCAEGKTTTTASEKESHPFCSFFGGNIGLKKLSRLFLTLSRCHITFWHFLPSKQPSVCAEALEKESHPLPKTAKKKSLQQQAAAGYEARAASMVVVACSLEKAFA